jgi:5-methyltetrahydropteroyltriglutamate--homocysteine methyltransferase
MPPTDRILTTHAGSLPRPIDLLEMVRAKVRGEAIDEAAFARRLPEAVAEIVRQQADLGIDVVDDGEFSKPSFVTYVRERLSGLEPTGEPRASPWAKSREALAFPEFYQAQIGGAATTRQVATACRGPVAYKGQAQLKRDLDNLKAALAGVNVTAAFVPSISPANVEDWNKNEY